MRQKLRTFILTITMLLPMMGLVPAVSAVDVLPACEGVAADTSVCKSVNPGVANTNPVIHVLKVAITIVSIVIGIASVIVIILSGLRIIASNGDSQAVAKARSSIIYALAGIVIAVLAGSIVAFVLNNL